MKLTGQSNLTVSGRDAETILITPDFSFLHEVEEASGEKISLCYQCQKCSSGCPVTFAMDYLPHVLLRMVQLGLKDRVLNSTTFWICASCETCTTRCPNEIDIAGVMDTLRRMSLELKAASAVEDIPKFHQSFLNSIKSGGRVHEVGMLAGFVPRTNLWAKLRSGELFEEARLGWEMLWRGKLKFLPHKMRHTEEIKRLFK